MRVSRIAGLGHFVPERVVTNGDPDEIAWRQNLDALNFMMSDTSIPHHTRVDVRRYFRKSKRLFKRKSYDALVSECLSQALQRDVRYQIASGVFNGVWWLRACEEAGETDFLQDLSIRVNRVAYGPATTCEKSRTRTPSSGCCMCVVDTTPPWATTVPNGCRPRPRGGQTAGADASSTSSKPPAA